MAGLITGNCYHSDNNYDNDNCIYHKDDQNIDDINDINDQTDDSHNTDSYFGNNSINKYHDNENDVSANDKYCYYDYHYDL